MKSFFLLSIFLCFAWPFRALADDSALGPWPWDGHFQMTAIPQGHGGFDAAYSGQNSLQPQGELETSFTSTLFLGTRVLPGLELYADPEGYAGSGLSQT